MIHTSFTCFTYHLTGESSLATCQRDSKARYQSRAKFDTTMTRKVVYNVLYHPSKVYMTATVSRDIFDIHVAAKGLCNIRRQQESTIMGGRLQLTCNEYMEEQNLTNTQYELENCWAFLGSPLYHCLVDWSNVSFPIIG